MPGTMRFYIRHDDIITSMIRGKVLEGGLKPPLKWAGGKRWLSDWVMKTWTDYKDKRYVEPFCGGMAIALSLMPEKALLNDINLHLINFYSHIQKGLNIGLEMKNDRTLYYDYRKRFNELAGTSAQETKEAAELFYYLNRTCFNGLSRFNNSGKFNVPFGKYRTINYKHDFTDYKEAFKKWVFSALDFEKLAVTSEDFVYADPPYDVQFTHYSRGDFSWPDQERLAKWLSGLDCPVIVSNQYTERIFDLYQSYGFEMIMKDAPRYISSDGNRSMAREIVGTLRIKNEAHGRVGP